MEKSARFGYILKVAALSKALRSDFVGGASWPRSLSPCVET